MKVAKNIIELIGQTPMVKINKLVDKNDAEIFAKLEWFNIGGSIKDRMVLYMLVRTEKKGKIKGKTILEATSGNTGIALAMLGAVYGYKVKILMPESESKERRKIIQAFGAGLVLTPTREGEMGAIKLRDKILKREPQKFICFNQFDNKKNPRAHYQTTAKEILIQTKGNLDMVILSLGTAGTGVGVAMRMKKEKPGVKIVGVVPQKRVSIAGLRPLAEIEKFKIFKRKFFDQIFEIKKEEMEKVKKTARELARKEGLLVGPSSAAVMYVALKKAKELKKGKRICVILPDSGLKYLSENLYDQKRDTVSFKVEN